MGAEHPVLVPLRSTSYKKAHSEGPANWVNPGFDGRFSKLGNRVD
jgi:hypothetical protein